MLKISFIMLALSFFMSSAYAETYQCHRVQGSANGSSSYDVFIQASSLAEANAQNQLWARSGQFRVAGTCYLYQNPRACASLGQSCSQQNNWCCSSGLACMSAGAGSNYGICR